MSTFGKQVIAECHIMSIQQNNEDLLLIQFIDLTEIKRINSKLENILKSMNEGVHVIDEKGIIILENDAAISMLGWQGENTFGRHAHLTAHHHHADQSVYPIEECPITATLHDGIIRQIENDIFWRKDDTFFPVEYTVTPILNPHGEGQAVTVVFRDITYRKRLEDELRKQATHDVLTGLPNRRLLMDRLGQAININRRQNTLGALIYLDLNNFKNLNDNYGHEAGDFLLIEVANRLILFTRESDTVARLGGDEFVILLLGLDADLNLTKRYVDLFTEKLTRKLNEDYVIGEIVHHCSASIGVKIFYDGELPEKILREADSAMYKMKRDRE
jgi:diguanylate cyclase (GGDEF)-like protein/PAS domain S-box-containing protein